MALLISLVWITHAPRPAEAIDWATGDVFLGVSNGSYQVRAPDGTLLETISDGLGGATTGCAFNNAGNKLYTTNFGNTKVVVYDLAHPHTISQVIDTAVTSPGGHSESVVFDALGNFYVGHPDGNDLIHKYDPDGNLITTFSVAVDNRGTDWIDLSNDQMTLFYTSEGRAVQRFDTGTNTQLANFANLPGSGNAFALRLLPPGDGSGGLIVADGLNVKRLDGAGNVVQTYDVAGENSWFSMNLDPNGTSFWAGNFTTANYYKFNINSGVVEAGPFNTGTGNQTLFGICLLGEITAAQVLTLEPLEDVNETGTTHTVTATLRPAEAGVEVTFTVLSGPNAGDTDTATTDSSGQASFTYTGDGGEGTDVIEARISDDLGQVVAISNQVSKTWKAPEVGNCNDLLISNYQSAPDSEHFVEIANVGSSPVLLDGCSLHTYDARDEILIGDASASLSGTLDPGDTILVGNAGVSGVDIVIDGSLPEPGALGIYNGPPPPDEAPFSGAPADVTGMTYVDNTTVFGVAHNAVPAHNSIYACIYGGSGVGPFTRPFQPLSDCFMP